MDYAFPSGVRRTALRRMLGQRLNLRAEGRVQGLRFHDTFDWRLHRSGWVLEILSKPRRAVLRGIADGRLIEQPLATDPPPRVAAWPDGAVKSTIEAVVGIRALLPVVELAGSADGFAVLNSDAKTVARVSLEEWKLQPPGQARATLLGRLRITPLRGWQREARTVSAVVADLGLTPAIPLRDAALALIGRQAGDYSTKFRVDLDAADDAALAARRILDRLYQDLLRNEEGTLQDIDAEFLHDFRVAVRRTRSALWAFAGLFPEGVLEPHAERFRELGRVTGHKRNLDVHLEDFDHHLEPLAPPVRERLLPLRAVLEEEHRAAARDLNVYLRSAAYRSLKRDWSRWLKQSASPAEGAETSVKQLADRVIRKTWKRLLRDGRAIGRKSPDEQLHDLRKIGKRLRYLLEFFRSLYPKREIGAAIGELKRLQDLLGEFQDQCVQIETLAMLASRDDGSAGDDIGRLVAEIDRRRKHSRSAFAASLRRFDSRSNHARYAALFGNKGAGP